MAELMVTLVTVLGGVPAADGGSRRRCCGFFFFLMQRPLFFFCLPIIFSFSPLSLLFSSLFSLKNPYVSLFRSLLSSSKTVGLSLSVSLSFFCRSFLFSPLSLLHSGGIYRGRGSGVDPAPSHRRLCMGCTSPALPRRRQRWPMEALLAGHSCSGISS